MGVPSGPGAGEEKSHPNGFHGRSAAGGDLLDTALPTPTPPLLLLLLLLLFR